VVKLHLCHKMKLFYDRTLIKLQLFPFGIKRNFKLLLFINLTLLIEGNGLYALYRLCKAHLYCQINFFKILARRSAMAVEWLQNDPSAFNK